MDTLIISDAPERPTFCQIIILKQEMEETGTRVDLLVFSDMEILFNEKTVGELKNALSIIEKRLKKHYSILAISLEVNSFKRIFNGTKNFLNLINRLPNGTTLLLITGSSILRELEKSARSPLHLYERRGVSKITKEFKRDLLFHIKSKSKGGC